MKFSEQNQAFYADEIDYPSMPADAIDITEENYTLLFQAVNSGRYVYLKEGLPTISEIKPDSYHVWDSSTRQWTISDAAIEQQKSDLISNADLKKAQLVNEAMASISVIQLKLQAGRTLKDDEKATLNDVLDYIDKVEAIDSSSAPDIEWPEQPG